MKQRHIRTRSPAPTPPSACPCQRTEKEQQRHHQHYPDETQDLYLRLSVSSPADVTPDPHVPRLLHRLPAQPAPAPDVQNQSPLPFLHAAHQPEIQSAALALLPNHGRIVMRHTSRASSSSALSVISF